MKTPMAPKFTALKNKDEKSTFGKKKKAEERSLDWAQLCAPQVSSTLGSHRNTFYVLSLRHVKVQIQVQIILPMLKIVLWAYFKVFFANKPW